MPQGVAFTYPDPSHVHSVVPVLAELARQGHRFTAYSSDRYREVLLRAGLEFRCYEHTMPPSGGGPFSGMARRLGFAETVLPGLISQLRADPPDYVIADAAAPWGGIAARVLNLRSIGYRATFVVRPGMITTGELAEMFYKDAPRDLVFSGLADLIRYYEIAQRLDRLYGSQTGDVIASLENRQHLNLVLISRELQFQGDSFDPAYHFVGRCPGKESNDGGFPWERLDTRPLIYVSLGTVSGDRPDFFRACFDAFRNTPYQVVMALGRVSAADLGTAPANFVVVEHAPQIELLRRAVLFISHAGPSSVEESLRHDVPLLVWPQAGCHFGMADRLVELGVALRLSSPITPKSLWDGALQVLNDPRLQQRAADLGARMRASGGGTAHAVRAIAAFLRQ